MIKDRIWTLMSRKISGEATSSELIELNDLLHAQSDIHLFQAIDEFWTIPPEKDEEFLEATYHLHLERLKGRGFDLQTGTQKEDNKPLFMELNTSVQKKRRRLLLGAAALVPVLVTLVFLLQSSKKDITPTLAANKAALSEVSTKTGSRTKIQLPDGSSVWLNGGSKLVYNRNFGETVREVELTGEGYFDVVKNINKPFIIHTKKMDIRVVGTELNVKAYPGEKNSETSLIRGSIEVTLKDRQQKILMKPNDKLIVSEEPSTKKILSPQKESLAAKVNLIASLSHLTIAADDISVIETAWVENKLMFDNESFEEVALKMEKWYGVNIYFAEPKLKSVHLTGTFEKETIKEALEALQISTPFFKYKIENNRINIFK